MELKITLKLSEYKRKEYYQSGTGKYQRWVRNTRQSDLPYGHGIVYLDFEGESIYDNLVNRTSRPYLAIKPLLIAEMRSQGLEFGKLRWSQRAGCSCPCSPGFIIQGGLIGQDWWATISQGSEQLLLSPAEQDARQDRELAVAASLALV